MSTPIMLATKGGKRRKGKRSTRNLTIDELRAVYDRAVTRALRAADRANRLRKILDARIAVAKRTAATLAGELGAPGAPKATAEKLCPGCRWPLSPDGRCMTNGTGCKRTPRAPGVRKGKA